MTGSLFAFEGMSPRVAADAFVAPTATLIGDVTVGARSSVWFGCVLRGDTNFVRVGARSNIQDGTIVHVAHGTLPAIIGDDVTVGHAAIIHACTLHDGAFVGMGATVLDGAVIEAGGMLAAGALLAPGKRIGRNEMWRGLPATLVRVMPESERLRFAANAQHYVELAGRMRASLEPVPAAPRLNTVS